MASADILIGGGGIIGLSTALELARGGFRVRVIERGRAMAEASWAAAGMLAAEDPENPEELTPLAALSRDLYPGYLSRLEHLSGHAVPVRTHNALQATRPGGHFHCRQTGTRGFLSPEEARQRVESLATGGRSFLWLAELSLDPRDLCAALPLAAVKAGVVLQEKTEVQSVTPKPGAVEIATSAGIVSAAAFVNCCGAWAAGVMPRLFAEPSGSPAETHAESVEPRKGQMLTVRLENPQQLPYVLRTPDVYLVPRGDGRVVIGATVERAGFDRRVDSAALHGLLAQAADLWPPIASAPVMDSWAGLRPGTGDGLPLIGRAGAPHCWLATGHFRNGILLAPATAAVMRQMIEGKAPGIALDAFALHRPARC